MDFQSQTDADYHFMGRAFDVARDSDDPAMYRNRNSAVGSVIVRNYKVLSESANRVPPALRDVLQYIKKGIQDDDRYLVIEHAERAAIYNIFNNKLTAEDATIYCTRFPCSDCTRAIIWVGISRLVVAQGISDETKWLSSQRVSLQMLRDADVTVRYLPKNG